MTADMRCRLFSLSLISQRAEAIKVLAQEHDTPVYQPQSLKKDGEEYVKIINDLAPDCIVVAAYGKMLPKSVLDIPRLGCVNVHGSLLPKYRGAGPIQWAVLGGEKESGVTSMQMDAGLDTGDMLISAKTEIGENDTAGDLHDKLSLLGADVMSETIRKIEDGTIQRKKQDDSLSNYAPMLSKELCPIDWNLSAREVHNKVRGLSPWPLATFELDGKVIKAHKTLLCGKAKGKAGEVIENSKRLVVCCGDGEAVEIVTLQPQGKKAMNAADYMRGNPIEKGVILK